MSNREKAHAFFVLRARSTSVLAWVSVSTFRPCGRVRMRLPQNDEMKWNTAVTRFAGFCSELPLSPSEDDIPEYHDIIKLFEMPVSMTCRYVSTN
jgi:hypothetical protein